MILENEKVKHVLAWLITITMSNKTTQMARYILQLTIIYCIYVVSQVDTKVLQRKMRTTIGYEVGPKKFNSVNGSYAKLHWTCL
jgi:hypothetical protein